MQNAGVATPTPFGWKFYINLKVFSYMFADAPLPPHPSMSNDFEHSHSRLKSHFTKFLDLSMIIDCI